jgi:putative FmdB family regulatory protein
MPIYEYRCGSCHHRFDSYRPTDERDEPSRCPACGVTTRGERVWSSAAVAVRVAAGKRPPRSGAEALAGGPVQGLGSRPGHARTSVLQRCGGLGHAH